MDANTSDLLSKLKFVGRIQKGEKLNTRYLYVQPESWITRLSRTIFASDNRMSTFHFIESTIASGFDIISLNKNSIKISDKCLICNVIIDLKSALKGIANLKDTYATDVMYCCKLDTLIQQTDGKLSELESEVMELDLDEDSETT